MSNPSGWGVGGWGTSQWGIGALPAPGGPPIIYPLSPQDGDIGVAQLAPIILRIVDDVSVPLALIQVTVNGITWVLGGQGINGATLTAVANAGHGWDIRVDPPAPYNFDTLQEVQVSAQDGDGNLASLVYHFAVGVGPRLLEVKNPFDNMLLAYFNRPMRLDGAFFSPKNWQVTAFSPDAAVLEIVAIAADPAQPNLARLTYTGGSNDTYELTLIDIVSATGEAIERGFNTAIFTLDFGEEAQPGIRLFNSIFGPLGIRQGVRTRRTMDDHVVNRSIALALDEQFRLRMQQLDGTAGRDGRPGKLRT